MAANLTDLPTDVRSLIHDRIETEDGAVTYLDPGRPEEKEAIEQLLDRSGKHPDGYPALYRSIADEEVDSSPQRADHCTLVDAGRTAEGKATARTWVQSPGGAIVSGVHTLVLDRESGETLASGSHTQVGGGLVRNATEADGAQEAREQMTAVSFFHAQRSPGDPVRFGLAATPIAAPMGAVKTIVVVPKAGKRVGYVRIGLSRPTDPADCDYFYAGSGEPDRLVVPLVGTAQFAWEVTGTPTTVSAGLYCTGSRVNLLSGYNPLPRFSIDKADKTILHFNFPADQKSIQQTESLQFNPLNKADETKTFFWIQVPVKVATTPALKTFSICSTDWPDPPSENCTQIPNIEFWWHCIQSDAQVTLADGTQTTLGAIDSGSAIKMADGTAANVVATTLDHHDAGTDDPLFELVTVGGKQVVISERHPVLTPSGQLVLGGRLQPGAEIQVEGGTDTVASLQPTSYSGLLVNLELETTGTGSFFANGIAVGDMNALEARFEEARYSAEEMIPDLPEDHPFRTDFDSAVEHATARR